MYNEHWKLVVGIIFSIVSLCIFQNHVYCRHLSYDRVSCMCENVVNGRFLLSLHEQAYFTLAVVDCMVSIAERV